MADPALKQALHSGDIVVAPGVYDLISALVADRMGFPALYVTGYGTVASSLGLPDAGLASYRDMLERISQIVARTKTPVIADGDTGYGGLLNVRHTVQGYEAAGVSAIQLEDQVFPKKCGHTPKREVIGADEMARKIRVARDSRSSDDFLIIARTDARTAHGLDEALLRGEAYAEAGADVIFIESPESEAEMTRIAQAIDRPLLANMVPGGRTPLLPAERLQELGFALAIHPVTGLLAATRALEESYRSLQQPGGTGAEHDLYSFDEFNSLVGFEDIWAFEKKYAE